MAGRSGHTHITQKQFPAVYGLLDSYVVARETGAWWHRETYTGAENYHSMLSSSLKQEPFAEVIIDGRAQHLSFVVMDGSLTLATKRLGGRAYRKLGNDDRLFDVLSVALVKRGVPHKVAALTSNRIVEHILDETVRHAEAAAGGTTHAARVFRVVINTEAADPLPSPNITADAADQETTMSDTQTPTKTEAAKAFGAAVISEGAAGLKRGTAKAVADEAVIALVKAIDNPVVSMVMVNRWARTIAGLTIAGGLGLTCSIFPTLFGEKTTPKLRAVSLAVFGGYAAVDGAEIARVVLDKYIKPVIRSFVSAAAKRGVNGAGELNLLTDGDDDVDDMFNKVGEKFRDFAKGAQ